MKKLFAFSKKQSFAAGGKGRASFDMAFRDRRGSGAFRKAKKRKKKAFFGERGSEAFFSAWRAAASNDKGHADMLVFALKC